MDATLGLRERKKVEMRHRLGDVAAKLFAERGYDDVTMADVAHAAGVADQTVYNYFPTKPDLVLDRADEILARTRRIIVDRAASEAPADAIRQLVQEDIDRLLSEDPALARGEFPALCLTSGTLRRSALEFRSSQAEAIAAALGETDPGIPPLVALAHAWSIVAVISSITDRIGAVMLAGTGREEAAAQMRRDADVALTDAAENFRQTSARVENR